MKKQLRRLRSLRLLSFTALILPAVVLAADPQLKDDQSAQPFGQVKVPENLVLEPWSDSLFVQFGNEYGEAAVNRMRYVYDIVQKSQSRRVLDKLDIANSTVNQLEWVSDQEAWNVEDYWATPLELIAKAGGDCEDMAIAKFVMLRMMGVSQRNLYLGYVKLIPRNEAHMVLVWSNDERTDVRVLDNFDKEVKPAKERMDLQAIYLTDVYGHVILIDDDGTQRSIKSEVDAKRMSKLETLRQHILETREKYKEYNEGRPLFKDQ